jgi:hypothetical protein
MEAQTFDDLANDAIELVTSTRDRLSAEIAKAAKQFREHAARGSDLPVPADREDMKRECLAMWRTHADYLDSLAFAMDRATVSGEQLKREISDMLLNGLNMWSQEPPESRGPIADLLVERAANIAQLYQGRVLSER